MTGPRVHLIYPHGGRISCPDAIGRKLAEHLSSGFEIVLHHHTEQKTIRPEPGDRLIGHPHPDTRTVFQRSVREKGWARTIMLCPYAHGDLRQVAAWDTILPYCDAYLAITGNYWIRTMRDSPFAHWIPRITHVDLAVDRVDFPVVKKNFAPPGQRRFLYIGNTVWVKNTPYLSSIAAELPGYTFGWIGEGRKAIRGFTAHGPANFSEPASRQLVSQYDFLVTAGFSDANPTVILESMAWGLIPVCTPQSGYEGFAGIPTIPLGDKKAAASILRRLQEMPSGELEKMQSGNWGLLDTHFHWTRFADQVRAALLADGRPELGTSSWARTCRLRLAAATSPYAPWHPWTLARNIKNRWRIV